MRPFARGVSVRATPRLHEAGQPTPLDNTRRIIIFVVNSLSIPSTKWNKSENPPGTVDVLVKSAGVPIDRYSGEMVEQLKDIDARWSTLREIRDSPGFAKDKNPALAKIVNAPNADIYVIDVSFKALQDKSERNYLNQLPTSFHLPDEAVDRLRAAARTLILSSPDLQQALRDEGTRIVDRPIAGSPAMSRFPPRQTLNSRCMRRLHIELCVFGVPFKNGINLPDNNDG